MINIELIHNSKLSEKLLNHCYKINTDLQKGIVLDLEAANSPDFKCLFEILNTLNLTSKFVQNGFYFFPDDVSDCLVYSCLSHNTIKSIFNFEDLSCSNFCFRNISRVKNHYPEFFTALSGVELSIFDSKKLMQQHLISSATECYFATQVKMGFNIPLGFVALNLHKGIPYSAKSINLGVFICPAAELSPSQASGSLPLDSKTVFNATPFQIDSGVPQYRPAVINPSSFYCGQYMSVEDGFLYNAYNYFTKQKGLFKIPLKTANNLKSEDLTLEIQMNTKLGNPVDSEIKLVGDYYY